MRAESRWDCIPCPASCGATGQTRCMLLFKHEAFHLRPPLGDNRKEGREPLGQHSLPCFIRYCAQTQRMQHCCLGRGVIYLRHPLGRRLGGQKVANRAILARSYAALRPNAAHVPLLTWPRAVPLGQPLGKSIGEQSLPNSMRFCAQSRHTRCW